MRNRCLARTAGLVAASTTRYGSRRRARRAGSTARSYLACGGLGTHEAVSIALWVKAESLGHTWNPLLFGNDVKSGVVHFSLLADGRPNVAINTGEQNWTHRTARTCGGRRRVAPFGPRLRRPPRRTRAVLRRRQAGRRGSAEPRDPAGPGRLPPRRMESMGEDSPANNFHGAISDVRIYSGMLTDAEAAHLAARELNHGEHKSARMKTIGQLISPFHSC